MARGRGLRKYRRCGYYGCECAPMVTRPSSGNFSDRWEVQSGSDDAKVLVHGGVTKDPSRPDYDGHTDIRIVDKTGGGVLRIHKNKFMACYPLWPSKRLK